MRISTSLNSSDVLLHKIDFLDIVMQFHVKTIVVDNKRINIWNNGFRLFYIKQQAICGNKDKSIWQLFPCVFVEFHDSGIKPWLVVSVKRQVSAIVPFSKLVNVL